MLLSLHIENVAVIKCVDIDFEKGFTALTGETGAGKSILIDSIGFLLGARGDRELLRTGEEKAVVSAMFGNLGERLILRRSPKALKMLKLKHAGFFSVLNAKLAEYELKN